MTRPSPSRVLAPALAVFGLALAVRAPQLWQEASGDELFHVLAARQWLVDGTFSIHGGQPYDRVRGFTLAVAWLFRAFGESLPVSRLPAALSGAALAAVAFVWLHRRGERGAAWIAAALLALDPELVRLSQMCRFYAPQHLLFLIGAICVCAATEGGSAPRRRVLAGALAGGFLWAAQEAQVVSRIGIGGIGLYVALVSAPTTWRLLRAHARARVGATVGSLGAAAIAAYGLQQGWLSESFALARHTDLWASHDAADWRFYHHYLLDAYPTFWTLFPAAVLVGLAGAPRVVLLCTCVFGTAFGVHSFMAFKTPRFLSYAFPFFLIVWAIALVRLAPALARVAESAWLRLTQGPASRRLAHGAGALAAATALLFALASNNAYVRTARLLVADPSFRDSITFGKNETLSFARAARALAPLLARAEVVVVTEDVKALYYLGRADFVINQDHLFENLPLDGEPREEFAVDPKIDVPVLSKPESIDRIARCHADGLIVAQTGFLNADWIVPAAMRAHLLARFERVPLPDAWGVTALRWSTAEPAGAAECVLRAEWREGLFD